MDGGEHPDFAYDLAQRTGIITNPDTAPYVDHDEPTHDEKVELLTSAGLLTERQAEALVYRDLEDVGREEAAEEMGLASPSALDDYRSAAGDKLLNARLTLAVFDELDE